MTADTIEANLQGVTPWYLDGRTLLEMGAWQTSEGQDILEGELYCVTEHGIWRVE